MDVFLISPSGTKIELFTDVGDSANNFTNTILDDEATTSIAAVTALAPFTGTFKPEKPLSALDGESPNGTWKLKVRDDEAPDTGTLNNWSLTFNSSNGGTGADTLTGGAGKDYFQFDSKTDGIDVITDFASAPDTIRLKASGFGGGLSKGKLPAAKFVLGSVAKDSGDRIIYDRSTGALFFDEDGIGSIDKIQIATLQNKPLIKANDFVIF